MRYDPVTDRFIDYSTKETTTSTTGTININEFPKYTIQHIVEVSDESIGKIADAVARKLANHKVDRPQGWISCGERLPEKPDIYTVTDSNDRVVFFAFTGTDSSREYWKKHAKAWMPSPEPWKGTDDD